jgi:hypothetical protein
MEVKECQLLQLAAAKHKELCRAFCCDVISRLEDLKTKLFNQNVV